MIGDAIRQVAEDPTWRQVLILLQNGFPFDVAMSLPDADRVGLVIAIGLMAGNEFDWQTGRWLDPRE